MSNDTLTAEFHQEPSGTRGGVPAGRLAFHCVHVHGRQTLFLVGPKCCTCMFLALCNDCDSLDTRNPAGTATLVLDQAGS
jgi:hypothetical protein